MSFGSRFFLDQFWFAFFIRPDNYLDIFIIVTKHFDYRFRANNRTNTAARTIGIICLGGKVTGLVGFLGYDDAVIRTNHNTQAAAFTPFGIDYYFACHRNKYVSISL
jgi:hypothetical protein